MADIAALKALEQLPNIFAKTAEGVRQSGNNALSIVGSNVLGPREQGQQQRLTDTAQAGHLSAQSTQDAGEAAKAASILAGVDAETARKLAETAEAAALADDQRTEDVRQSVLFGTQPSFMKPAGDVLSKQLSDYAKSQATHRALTNQKLGGEAALLGAQAGHGAVQPAEGKPSTLADIAPTMLDLLNISKPAEMSGKSLIENKS